MREYELEILEQYEIEIKGTRRIRGAFFCDTDKGAMLLKETGISEKRASFMYHKESSLEALGMAADTPVFTKDGTLLAVSRDGTKYIMKKWYAGRECDLKKWQDLTRASANLAELHIKLNEDGRRDDFPGTADFPAAGRSPQDEVKRRNRELKKIRAFIRGRTSKNEFEYLFLSSFEKMYAMAEKVAGYLSEPEYAELHEQSIRQRRIAHGDYNYHNLLMLQGGIATTGFEHMHTDIQVRDLYYFIRKAMEKFQWKENTGRTILDAYESLRPLSETEKRYMGLALAYPEKYWKTAVGYYHSGKSWMPEKNVEKLQTAVRQWDEKYGFLENVFLLRFH